MRRNERWLSVRMLCRFSAVELLSQVPECIERRGMRSCARAAQAVMPPRMRQPSFFGISRIGSLAALLLFFGKLPLFAGLPVYFDPSGLLEPATNISQVSTNRAQTAATNSMDALDDKHILAIGDRLSFRIEEDLDDPKPLVVTDSGDLECRYIRPFPGGEQNLQTTGPRSQSRARKGLLLPGNSDCSCRLDGEKPRPGVPGRSGARAGAPGDSERRGVHSEQSHSSRRWLHRLCRSKKRQGNPPGGRRGKADIYGRCISQISTRAKPRMT